ncbi:MAG: dihydroxy-acid dehydratase, partial [Planctomycetota bacterium]|nr:dihydroxy-acid dehydratase [Planctomycetota bacterium]
NGDTITINAESNTITVNVSDEDMQKRREVWTAPPFKATRGTLYRYIKTVKSASDGCVTDE